MGKINTPTETQARLQVKRDAKKASSKVKGKGGKPHKVEPMSTTNSASLAQPSKEGAPSADPSGLVMGTQSMTGSGEGKA